MCGCALKRGGYIVSRGKKLGVKNNRPPMENIKVTCNFLYLLTLCKVLKIIIFEKNGSVCKIL